MKWQSPTWWAALLTASIKICFLFGVNNRLVSIVHQAGLLEQLANLTPLLNILGNISEVACVGFGVGFAVAAIQAHIKRRKSATLWVSSSIFILIGLAP